MLPFGSVTSLVPLAILGFLYLVYFSASALHKEAPEETKASPGKILHVQSVSSPEHDLPDFRITDNQPEDNSGLQPPVIFIETGCVLFNDPGSWNAGALHRVFMFLPRPPPYA